MSEAGHVKPLPQLQLNVARQECRLNIARVHVFVFSQANQTFGFILCNSSQF